MAIENFDLRLDFNDDEGTAHAYLHRHGFNQGTLKEEYIKLSTDLIIEKLNSLGCDDYAILNMGLKKREIYLGEESAKLSATWRYGIQRAPLLLTYIIQNQTLLSYRHGLRSNNPTLHKNAQQCIKKINLKHTLDLNVVAGRDAHAPAKLIDNILTVYKSDSVEITSTKDIVKLVGLSKYMDKIQIKFYSEDQAAQFVLRFGDSIPY